MHDILKIGSSHVPITPSTAEAPLLRDLLCLDGFRQASIVVVLGSRAVALVLERLGFAALRIS